MRICRWFGRFASLDDKGEHVDRRDFMILPIKVDRRECRPTTDAEDKSRSGRVSKPTFLLLYTYFNTPETFSFCAMEIEHLRDLPARRDWYATNNVTGFLNQPFERKSPHTNCAYAWSSQLETDPPPNSISNLPSNQSTSMQHSRSCSSQESPVSACTSSSTGSTAPTVEYYLQSEYFTPVPLPDLSDSKSATETHSRKRGRSPTPDSDHTRVSSASPDSKPSREQSQDRTTALARKARIARLGRLRKKNMISDLKNEVAHLRALLAERGSGAPPTEISALIAAQTAEADLKSVLVKLAATNSEYQNSIRSLTAQLDESKSLVSVLTGKLEVAKRDNILYEQALRAPQSMECTSRRCYDSLSQSLVGWAYAMKQVDELKATITELQNKLEYERAFSAMQKKEAETELQEADRLRKAYNTTVENVLTSLGVRLSDSTYIIGPSNGQPVGANSSYR